jgi:excinuclease UvrABC nuclease subunit
MPIDDRGQGFTFDERTMATNAPNASGVYAIYSDRWLYVGESNDIQRRLLEHARTAGTCILRNQPRGFVFELWATEPQRVARQNTLIAQLRPGCNQMMG